MIGLRRLQRRQQRPPRLKGMSLNRMLPNVLTMLALCSGLTAVRFGVEERWESAVIAIVIAAIFDALDGRIARLLNGASQFGAELDSLSDVISFGVAPAVLIYLWVMHTTPTLGWIAVLAFAVCCALRLARFNTKLGASDLPAWAYNYFTGVPAPAGAGLALLPMIVSFSFGPGITDHPLLVGVWTVFVALLMVSWLPTFSFKGVRVPQAYVVPVLAGVGLLAAALVSATWLTLAAIAVVYLATLPLSWREYRRLEAQAAALQTETQTETPAAAPAEDAPAGQA